MSGGQPLGLGDATSAVADLADLADLESALGQEYAGANLEDVDEEAVRRALGRQAVDDLQALRRLERELQRQGYLTSDGGNLELTPKAVRRLGDTALRQVFAGLEDGMRSGDHDRRDAGQAGDTTGATREWEFGDEQPIDVPGTVRSALLRSAAEGVGRGRVRLTAQDFRVAETERRSPRPRSACWSTFPTRWRCAAPGRWPSRPRWRCTRCCAPSTRRTRSRSSGSPTTPGNCTRPSWPGSAGTWSRAPTCTTR